MLIIIVIVIIVVVIVLVAFVPTDFILSLFLSIL
jgi:hypothetical protein